MKRYLLFAGDDYYPQGGINDLVDFFDTVELAKEKAERIVEINNYDWYHIYDIVECKIILNG